MFYFRMALRNIFRRYGRTTLSMLSIVFGVAIIISTNVPVKSHGMFCTPLMIAMVSRTDRSMKYADMMQKK